MKKRTFIVLMVLLVSVTGYLLSGCVENAELTELATTIENLQSEIDSLKDENGSLKQDFSEMEAIEDRVISLEQRIKRLETTISMIEILDDRITILENKDGDAQQFNELKTLVETLQGDLLNNLSGDEIVKSQVSQMQLKLDEISTNIGEIDFVETLNSIQKDITQLYGEVDRTIEFENGKEYEVKLNGVVYYTVTIEVEYHKGKVSSSSLDLGLCNNNGLHWCGNIEIYNVGTKTIEELQMANMMSIVVDDDVTHGIGIFKQKNGQAISGEDAVIRPGERKRWYFGTSTISKHPSNSMGFSFKVDQGEKLTLLVLENVWDGVQEPIIGEVV